MVVSFMRMYRITSGNALVAHVLLLDKDSPDTAVGIKEPKTVNV